MKIKIEYVSYNQPVDKANAEVEKLEAQGYLVVETYWNDFNCGQILQLPKEDNDVLEKHETHMEICREQTEWRKRHLMN